MEKLNLKLKKPIANLYRDNTVLLLITYGERFLVATKKECPENMYRFVGGGVDEGETPENAALRELREELNINSDIKIELTSLNSVKIIAQTSEGTFEHTIYGFHYSSTTCEFDHDSELSNLKWLEISKIGEYLEGLKDVKGLYKDPRIEFYWEDYAEIYRRVEAIFFNKYGSNRD
jgi:8-oxo-dGTP pyrophosphatase MutT (NUDIX family)